MFMAASGSEAQSNRQMNQIFGGKPGFTSTQGQYLAFIEAYTRVNLRPPAEADIQRRFGVTPPSVHQMVLTLECAGLIRRQPATPRSIQVLSRFRRVDQRTCFAILCRR
jgi:DNA-binding MarR family transcriptional regulator